MNLKKIVKMVVVSVLLVSCQKPTNNSHSEKEIEVISRDKIAIAEVEHISFSGDKKTTGLPVLDVTKDDVLQIFKELENIKFPIYATSSYAPRKTRDGRRVSLHAYAAAIDVNYLMNPYFDARSGIMIPIRNKDREKDKHDLIRKLKGISDKEIAEILKVVIDEQPENLDDKFLNRGIVRKGMVTPEVVEIFKKHGFNEWRGQKEKDLPIDYMHFQIPRSLAEKLAATNDIKDRKRIWEEHKKGKDAK